MMGFGNATRIYLAPGATDMRKGFEGLYGLVKSRLQIDPLSGHIFVFCNRASTRIKVLFWDGSGLWICAKRLERGRFSWPAKGIVENGHQRHQAERISLSKEELTLLLGGIDLLKTKAKKKWYRKEER